MILAIKLPENTKQSTEQGYNPIEGEHPSSGPAAETAEPSPGYENTFSARTLPPKSSAKEANCRVMAGRSVFLKP